jgi:hypothetical protein
LRPGIGGARDPNPITPREYTSRSGNRRHQCRRSAAGRIRGQGLHDGLAG